MRGLRLGLAVVVSTTCIAAVPATSASATPRTITIKASASTRQVGSNVTFSGKVSPNAHGQTIALQQRRAAANQPWTTVKTMTLSSASQYRFLRYFHTTGAFQLRTKLGSVVSPVKPVTVYQWHFLSDLPTAATSGGCITNGSAQIRGGTYAHTVSMDLNCAPDVWADWHLAKGCYRFTSIVFFTDASSSDAKATLSISVAGTDQATLTVAESDFSAPGQGVYVGGKQDLRLEANSPSGTTPIAAFGNAAVNCSW